MQKCISGKKIADKIKIELENEIFLLNKEIIFSIIYVGQDSVIDNFIKYKKRFGDDIGVNVTIHKFDENISQDELLTGIEKISKESSSMIIQLPLPEHLDTRIILDSVPIEKDIDVLSTASRNAFALGENTILPPVTGAIIEILKNEGFKFLDKKIVIVGFGDLVGKPFSLWLDRNGFDYDIVTKKTNDEIKSDILKNADVIISGVGSPNLIQSDMIKEGVVLIDAGTSEVGKKVTGDIDMSCYEKSLFYTPVPGGIGPLTIAILYQNILKAHK